MAMIEFRAVDKSFGSQPVLRGFDLVIPPREIFFIVGSSGAGKSVTIKLIVGLLSVDAGEIHYAGKRIDHLSEAEFAKIRTDIVPVFQHAMLFDWLSIEDNVALPLRKRDRIPYAQALEVANAQLQRVGLGSYRKAMPTDISDSLRKRAAIARALTLRPKVLLFDEPTTGLDPISARQVDRLICELSQSSDMTTVVVSHDLVAIHGVADRIGLLYRGGVHLCAQRDEFLATDDPVARQFIEGRAHGPMETPGF